jgi:hypothetical protein
MEASSNPGFDDAAEQRSSTANRAGWPEDVLPIFEHALTCEFASISRSERPITWPLAPFVGEDGRTIDVSTGLSYPSKAERARRNPKVAMLFSDPVGSGLERPPTVLVQGLASVRDADLQANTDLYVRRSMSKLAAAWRGTPRFMVRKQGWYWVRIWIRVTPVRILWWPEGRTDLPPHRWEAAAGLHAPQSDPPPPGPPSPPWQDQPTTWRHRAEHALRSLGLPVLTVVGAHGYPSLCRVRALELDENGFALRLPSGAEGMADGGPASLTFHVHAEEFVGQENAVFVGRLARAGGGAGTGDGDRIGFIVDRVLGDFSLPGSRLRRSVAFLAAGRKLAPRLRPEAARRNQAVPKVKLPDDL